MLNELLSHWGRVAHYSKTNKMSINNLCVVTSTSIFGNLDFNCRSSRHHEGTICTHFLCVVTPNHAGDQWKEAQAATKALIKLQRIRFAFQCQLCAKEVDSLSSTREDLVGESFSRSHLRANQLYEWRYKSRADLEIYTSGKSKNLTSYATTGLVHYSGGANALSKFAKSWSNKHTMKLNPADAGCCCFGGSKEKEGKISSMPRPTSLACDAICVLNC